MSSFLKVSEAASLALHTMVLLAAEPETQMSANEAAAALGVSEAHLAKVLQRLARAGLVTSIRGPKGGFRLAGPADEVTLLEVYEAIEGPATIRNCLFGVQPRTCQGCIFGGLLSQVHEQVRRYLANTKLTQVRGPAQKARMQHANP